MLSMKFDGGKAVVQRILQAYGFTMQKQLHDHLGVGNGTVSTWIKRNYFPGEVVIRCALETGVSLEWLATGVGEVIGTNRVDNSERIISIPHEKLLNGRLSPGEPRLVDKYKFPVELQSPLYVDSNETIWLFDKHFDLVSDGYWLIEKGYVTSISFVTMAPGNKWIIDSIEWPKEEVRFIGKSISREEFF